MIRVWFLVLLTFVPTVLLAEMSDVRVKHQKRHDLVDLGDLHQCSAICLHNRAYMAVIQVG